MKKLSPIILLVFVLMGCKWASLQNGSGGTNEGSGSSSASKSGKATASSDPKADVVAASKKFLELPYFTANMEGKGDTELKSQVAYSAPDRFHVKYTGGTGAGMEMIWIGKDSYMNMNGKWTKMPASDTSIPTLRDSFTEEGLKTLSDVTFEGEDSVNGKSALVYGYKNVTPQGNYPFTSKIWVNQDTGVPMKIYVEYTNGALKNMTVNYDTESKVTIESPIGNAGK
jgi:outer membrane lipoprotein-sorting protein